MKKHFPNARMKHRPLTVNFRPVRQAINRRVAWPSIAVVGLLVSLACAVPSFAQILATAQLNVERRGHTATLLEDGKVLIVGGDNLNGMVSQAEIFDPVAQASSLAATLSTARTDHTATRLADGRVLVIGGRDQSGAITSTEIFNPVTVAFTAGPSMTAPRSGHTATALANGNILVAGGDASGSAEIYNLATQTFSPIAANMTAARKFHSAILTSSGQVLIVGGVNAQNTMLNTAEVFDPASQSFYIPPTEMQTQRALATLKLLPDGKVQIIGGDAELSMEVFDPTNGIFIAKALLPPNAALLGATLSTQSRAALFSPLVLQDPMLQGVLTPEQSALLDRADQSITELPSRNQALVAGGINSAGQILKSANLVNSSSASVTTDKTDYPPGEIVTITGSGFQANEQVQLSLHEFPEEYPDITFTAVTNQQGNFVATDFAPQVIDLDRIFTLTAIGQSSGFTAQTAFKDAVGLQSVSVGVQIPNPVVAGNQTSYSITVGFNGSGSIGCSATLSVISALPTGASASFSPNPVASNGPNVSSTLTISTNALTTPAGSSTFTVQATAPSGGGGQGCNGATVTAGGTLIVQAAIAPTTLTVQPAAGTYGGTTTLTATLTKTFDSSAVSGKSVSFTLNGASVGSATTIASGVATLSGVSLAGINAGTYNPGVNSGVAATFAGDSSFASSSGTATLTVNKVDPTCTVNGFTGAYDGLAHGATGSCTGVGGVSDVLTGLSIAPTTYTNVPGGLVHWTFTNNNYVDQSGDATVTISKATAICTVTGFSGTYDGLAHGATGSCTGVGGVSDVLTGLSIAPTTYTNVPGGLVHWTFSGGTNYNDKYGTAAIVINKADATVTVNGYTGVYDALPHGASGTATGIGGVDLSAGLNLGATFTNVPGGTANWTFTGGTNYNDKNGSVAIVITTGFAFNGFYSPIGGSVENYTGGSFADPLRAFKLGSTIPVKFGATWLNGGAALITGIHKLQAVKYSNATTEDGLVIDATPTDAATTGNEFRLTGTDWHFNLSTKGAGFKDGTWILIATLQDGSTHTVWITIKK